MSILNESYNVRLEVARNPNTPKETLVLLATDGDFGVRYGLARNPNTPKETLVLLATDEDSDVRYWVARNPNTPKETLVLLATDEDSDVRYGLARNPNTPQETLVLLATDEDSDVRYSVEQNPNTSEDILIMIKSKQYQLNKPLLKLAHWPSHFTQISVKLLKGLQSTMKIQTIMKIQITLSDNFQDNLNTVAKLAELDVSNDFFQTPFFRKWFASQELDELVNFYQVANYISNINFLTSVWSDITYDYFQNYQDILVKFEVYSGSIKDCYEWMKNNMTYQTYLHMVQHFYEKEGFQRTNEIYNDTFNQLSKVITRWGNTPEKITKPSKWRLQDFHDHMSYLYIESSSQNVEHHPEFIPFPVEVDNWKIYQPKNTVELQLWGRRVRNCVASYENSILKKKSAIVLIEENDKPTYTAELDYNALKEGELKFRQLVGLNNRSSDLDAEKRNVVLNLIESALQK